MIHNWADGDAIAPIAPETNALRSEWNLSGKFVLMYSGNMGRAHEFETILGAAQLLQDRSEIQFLFVGGGHYRDWLETEARARKLPNVRFQAYQPRERLAESLGVADVHLICLRPELEGLIVPSKIYGALAAGRPTLNVGDPSGEIGAMLHASRAGFSVTTGDSASLARHIEELQSNQALRAELGKNARQAFEARFDRRFALARWTTLLRSISAPSRAGDFKSP